MKTIQFLRGLMAVAMIAISSTLMAVETFEISGKVLKSDCPETNYASVTLLDAVSMKIVATTTCNCDGEFNIPNIEKGNYILLVRKPGYKNADERRITITNNGSVVETPSSTFRVNGNNIRTDSLR